MAAVSDARDVADAATTATTPTIGDDAGRNDDSTPSAKSLFDEFASFLISKQSEIIEQIERIEHEHSAPSDSGAGTERPRFTRDCWGAFANDDDGNGSDNNTLPTTSGGITRVLQKGNIIEKGACSLTLIRNGRLTAERAASIRGRQEGGEDGDDAVTIRQGDTYCAAALSMVLHTRSPLVPTFRSDVRIFLVESRDEDDENTTKTVAWFGGGSDLTPYYLFDDDIRSFHRELKTLCDTYQGKDDADGDASATRTMIDYPTMKRACDEYFYLPARSEHRGVGGMFFDDLPATPTTLGFVKDVASLWMPSWFPIVEKRQPIGYTEKQREWQLLRRGRYLEFNLLYDRGVKFGLANANPRVEGVMVSAPPLIAWEYNHEIEPDSEEDRLMRILKTPIEWV